MSTRQSNGHSLKGASRDNGSWSNSFSKSRPQSPSPGQNLEFKAAFVSAVSDGRVDGFLYTKEELLLALQNSGRNPTQKSLSKHWASVTDGVSFDQFCEICKKEPITTEDDLMKAFKKIDINGDGFLSHSELKKVMTTVGRPVVGRPVTSLNDRPADVIRKGETMTDEEVSKLIEEVDENKDGKLDYKEFCQMVLNTSQTCKEKAKKRYERKMSRSNRSLPSSSNLDKEPLTPSPRQKIEPRSPSPKPKTESSSPSVRRKASKSLDSEEIIPSSSRRNSKSSSKDKLGSHTSLRSIDNNSGASRPQPRQRVSSADRDSPKPAPRRLSRQEEIKPALSLMNLKLSPPRKLSDWKQLSSKGLIHSEDNGTISTTQYKLTLTKKTSVWVTASPSPTQSTATSKNPVYMRVLIVRDELVDDVSLVTFTECRDETGTCGVKTNLGAGSYLLFIQSSECSIPVKPKSSEPQKKLVKKKPGTSQYILTKEFKFCLSLSTTKAGDRARRGDRARGGDRAGAKARIGRHRKMDI